MNKVYVFFLLILSACATSEKKNETYTELIGKPAIPIQLTGDNTEVLIDDYIIDQKLDSVSTSGKGYEAKIDHDKIKIICDENSSPLGVISFWVGGNSNSVLLKRSNKKTITLKYKNEGKVQIKGEMNAWNVNANEGEVDGGYRVFQFSLNPGRYQYQFVVDGKETLDPDNPLTTDNGMGGTNSLVEFKRPERSVLPNMKTSSTNGQTIYLDLSNDADQVFVFCENQLVSYWKNMETGQLMFKTPDWAGTVKRTQIRVWAYNQHGASEEVLIPLEFGKAVQDPEQLTRKDWHAAIMYFLMVDRFNNGNKDNDRPTPDPEILPKANHFGGDLEGVAQTIQEGYFQDLGVNTIWLSPITLNPDDAWGLYPTPRTKFSGYHGYWPISNTAVDYRFGKKEDLDNIIDEAHGNDMNVLLDYVANHVHENNPIYQQNKDWATDLYLPDGRLNTELWDEHRLTTWFDTFLPTLDLSREEVYGPMTDTAMYWVINADLDGFRHDATKHIPEVFWRTLSKKVKKEIDGTNRTIFQIGETYGSRELINSYITTGQLDAQFDFSIYDDAISVFGRPEVSMTRLVNGLNESFAYYGKHNLMGYITGNQDKPRFISLASGAVKFDEDTKYAGWNRVIENEDPLAFLKLNQLHAFILTIPGIPCVYYGDEYGSPGGNDPDNRRMMKFPDELNEIELSTYETLKKVITFRNDHLALTYGDFEFLHSSDDLLVYKRSYFDDDVLIAFNKSGKMNEVTFEYDGTLNTNFSGNLSQDKGENTLVLEPFSFEILTKN